MHISKYCAQYYPQDEEAKSRNSACVPSSLSSTERSLHRRPRPRARRVGVAGAFGLDGVDGEYDYLSSSSRVFADSLCAVVVLLPRPCLLCHII